MGHYTVPAFPAGVKAVAFTCIGWQVSLRDLTDLIWQVMLHNSEMGFFEKLHKPLTIFPCVCSSMCVRLCLQLSSSVCVCVCLFQFRQSPVFWNTSAVPRVQWYCYGDILYLSVFLSVCLWVFLCLSVCLSVCLCVCSSVWSYWHAVRRQYREYNDAVMASAWCRGWLRRSL